ncbi:MAG: class I SAM-dependent methyltransferase [Rhodobacteraceae bacterium]|nr:class I SAM-dependent methyltransferase [Paracoccaceae bacterium]
MAAKYDHIGQGYAMRRRPDPRIAARIAAALGPAETVLNVGAGAGSYEPLNARVTAVEPSPEMIAQRPQSDAVVIQASAEALPFTDKSFDAAMAVLTVHHWQDQAQGLREMRRVTRGPVVILTYDPGFHDFWLTDYLPELIALDDRQMPDLAEYARWLGPVEVTPVPIPHDCSDGFLCANWRRPAAYLDAQVRAGSSSFWAIGDISAALQKLQRDLDSGAWARRYGHLLGMDECDCGYRLIRSHPHSRPFAVM